MKKEKFLALESLRGIAAISVVLFHFKIGSHLHISFIANAWLMVDFFFVLSGFVIALNYIDKIKNVKELFNFQQRRFLRLYPLHFIMVMTFLSIDFAKYFAEMWFGLVVNTRPFSVNSLSAFFANVFLIQNWTMSGLSFNYPSWSVSAEFITYALFAILVLITKANKVLISIILLICVFASAYFLNNFGMGTDNVSGPLRCLYSFSIGCLVFLIHRKYNAKLSFGTSLLPVFLIVLSIFVVSKYGTPNFEYLTLIPILFGATILSITLSRKESILNRALSVKWLVYLGTISYGIYMIHSFVWWLITRTFRFILKVPTTTDERNAVNILIENAYIAGGVSVLGVFMVLLLAHLSHKYFETKFYK